MDCTAVELAILADGAELPLAVAAHLKRCPACQRFAHLHQALLTADLGSAPPLALDQAVLSAARRALPRRLHVLRRARLSPLAAAAAVALTATIGVLAYAHLRGAATAPARAALVDPPDRRPSTSVHVDMASIESGLDAALAELDGLYPAATGQGHASGTTDRWDALTELEFDIYFESENLRQAGG